MSVTVSPQTRPSGGLRPWQERALRKLDAWDGEPFLLSAAPGAGKTRPALVFARELLRSRVVRRVAVVCPTTPLTRQWAEAAGRLGLHLVPDAGELRPPSDFDGVAVTYARAAASATRWASQCSPGTLVIADEAHHLGDDLAWGTGFRTAFGATRRWLLLSGTPFRSDAMPIPGVTYDDGLARPDVSYSLRGCRQGRHLPPGDVHPLRRLALLESGDDLVEASFSDALTGRDASRRYRTAISTELGDGLPKILASAHERLLALRKGDHRDAGGLVIAADSSHARRIAKVLRETCGVTPDGRAAHRGPRPPEAAGVPHRPRAVDRRREHGVRGRRHPAPAGRRLRHGREDAADLPPDRRALRAHDPGPARRRAQLGLPARRSRAARPRRRGRGGAAPRAAHGRGARTSLLDEPAERRARPSRRRSWRSSRSRPT